jgi:hypothetical protein
MLVRNVFAIPLVFFTAILLRCRREPREARARLTAEPSASPPVPTRPLQPSCRGARGGATSARATTTQSLHEPPTQQLRARQTLPGSFGEAAGPSGAEVTLRYEAQGIVLVEVGGRIRQYTRSATRRLLDGYDSDEMCTGARGQILVPWPNAIHDYVARGATRMKRPLIPLVRSVGGGGRRWTWARG